MHPCGIFNIRKDTPMNILITGGKGNVGRAVTRYLSLRGHTLTVLDCDDQADLPGVRYASCDLTQCTDLVGLARGCEAILHLAAIANPSFAAGTEIFRVNSTGSFNVFDAAAQVGIRRVVCASSINALGFNFGVKPFELSYFPVDEAHPLVTTDAYSFSKQITEDIATYYWRRDGISSTCLRLPGVYDPQAHLHGFDPHTLLHYRRLHQELSNLPTAEALALAQQAVAVYDERRAARAFEQLNYFATAAKRSDSPYLMPMGGFSDLFALVSTADAAQACEKALLAEYEGSHPLFIVEAENSVGVAAERLARLYFPAVTTRQRPLVGAEPLVSWQRARQLIGYEPQHTLMKLLAER
jgi:nucleoside-diphosphate-sugar epimerase